jgi:hypothetical protein
MAKSGVETIRGKNPVGWKRPFDDPIDLPGGRRLVTLEDAGNYITELPRAEHSAPEWQAAMRALMLVARGGPRSASCERYIATTFASSPIGKTTIGVSAS